MAVVGSGFGGSVAALRLTEKGYRVAVLEAGPRRPAAALPRTSWDVRRFLWAPRLRCYGIQRIHLLRNVVVLAGAGVGGGSLVYAGTLYRPGREFFTDRQWRGITDWEAELAPYYEQAERMLGVTDNPVASPADEVMRAVADEMGMGSTFRLAPVGICFGTPGTAPGSPTGDPYFGGVGPERRSCLHCGECMTGCRHGAKNTLDLGYLQLAERAGAVVAPMTTVTAIRPLTGGGYGVDTVATNHRRRRSTITAGQVVLAAGTLGTQSLLHGMVERGHLPDVSPTLGRLTRTNSESLVGAVRPRLAAPAGRRASLIPDYSRGVAITSSFHPDPRTQVEPCRYGHGSNAMGLLATLATDGTGSLPRWLRWLATVLRHPRRALACLDLRGWSERSIIALVMQTHDNSITVSRRHGRLTSTQGIGEPNPSWIPAAAEVARRAANRIGGWPAGTIGEIANIPMTAHILGGAAIGAGPESGVVDAYHRVFGHTGLHIVDGSAVSANLGVNPSLTITAQAERAFAMWPNAGDADPRPELGAPYQRVHPIPPRRPVVPESAPGSLRLPITPVNRGG